LINLGLGTGGPNFDPFYHSNRCL